MLASCITSPDESEKVERSAAQADKLITTMLNRLMKNSLFWTGVVIVVIGVGLMIAGVDLIAGLCALIGLGCALGGVAQASKIPPETKSFTDFDSNPTVIDLDSGEVVTSAKKKKKIVDLDS